MAEEEKGQHKGEHRPVYILTPDGMLSEVTSKASILKSLFEEYKIDSSIFQEIVDNEIKELKKELENELPENNENDR